MSYLREPFTYNLIWLVAKGDPATRREILKTMTMQDFNESLEYILNDLKEQHKNVRR